MQGSSSGNNSRGPASRAAHPGHLNTHCCAFNRAMPGKEQWQQFQRTSLTCHTPRTPEHACCVVACCATMSWKAAVACCATTAAGQAQISELQVGTDLLPRCKWMMLCVLLLLRAVASHTDAGLCWRVNVIQSLGLAQVCHLTDSHAQGNNASLTT